MEFIKQRQEDRKIVAIEADEERKRIEREIEEKERKEAERIRLEQEHREKIKDKEKARIQRQRDAGTYLTKEERKKRHHAQVQLGAAGIEVPARHACQIPTTDRGDSKKRGILYDDQRKANKSCMLTHHPTLKSIII